MQFDVAYSHHARILRPAFDILGCTRPSLEMKKYILTPRRCRYTHLSSHQHSSLLDGDDLARDQSQGSSLCVSGSTCDVAFLDRLSLHHCYSNLTSISFSTYDIDRLLSQRILSRSERAKLQQRDLAERPSPT
jgi:hypothetical protein